MRAYECHAPRVFRLQCSAKLRHCSYHSERQQPRAPHTQHKLTSRKRCLPLVSARKCKLSNYRSLYVRAFFRQLLGIGVATARCRIFACPIAFLLLLNFFCSHLDNLYLLHTLLLLLLCCLCCTLLCFHAADFSYSSFGCVMRKRFSTPIADGIYICMCAYERVVGPCFAAFNKH